MYKTILVPLDGSKRAEAILRHADLLAMTSHGWSGLSRVFYGSVAASVLQQIDRPLLLVRSQEHE